MWKKVLGAAVISSIYARLVWSAPANALSLAEHLSNDSASSTTINIGDGDTTLKLPFSLFYNPRIVWAFLWDPENAPTFTTLLGALFVGSFNYWKDVTASPIGKDREYRLAPFENFLHVLNPTPLGRSTLLPIQVGFTYLKMMKEVLKQSSAPGNATVSIYDSREGGLQGPLAGVLEILNTTPVHATGKSINQSTTQPSSDGSIRTTGSPSRVSKGFLSTPQDSLPIERAALDGLRELIQYVYEHNWRSHVSNSHAPGLTFTFPNAFDPRMEANLTLLTGPGVDSMMWDSFARMAQPVIVRLAAVRNFGDVTTAEYDDQYGRTLASIKVGPAWQVRPHDKIDE